VARIYVTLKGHWIWRGVRAAFANTAVQQPAGGSVIHLDGQAFARPGVQSDGTTPRVDLALPSGHGAKASDFESWLDLGRQPPPQPLQVTTVRFLNPNLGSSSAGDVTVPRTASDPKVVFKAAENINALEVTFNRAFVPESLGTVDVAAIFVERLASPNNVRFTAVLNAASATVARLELREPTSTSFAEPGNYRLTCLGTSPAGFGIKAADDGSFLDGDYDGQAGGNFTLDFTVA